MTDSNFQPKPPDNQVELAKERNRIAADRTILSWIRLSLTLIGIGFGIEQAVNLLYRQVGDAINPARLSYLLSVLFIGLGIYAIIMAAIDYRGELARLNQPEYVFTPRFRLGETVAIALLAIALLSSSTILFRLILAHGLG